MTKSKLRSLFLNAKKYLTTLKEKFIAGLRLKTISVISTVSVLAERLIEALNLLIDIEQLFMPTAIDEFIVNQVVAVLLLVSVIRLSKKMIIKIKRFKKK